MPITGSYTWRETPEAFHVQVPLKGTSPKKLDVFVAETVLKISYLPYLIDLDLKGSVDDKKSRAVFENGVLKILLVKKERNDVLWNTLVYEGSAEEKKERRLRSIEERSKRIQRQTENVKDVKRQQERNTLRNQMSLEQAERQKLDDLKAAEKKRAEEEVYEYFAKVQQQNAVSAESETSSNEGLLTESAPKARFENATFDENKPEILKEKEVAQAYDDETSEETAGKRSYREDHDEQGINESNAIWKLQSTENSARRNLIPTDEENKGDTGALRTEDDNRAPLIPPPRAATRLTFRHTPRVFPTPMRESTERKEAAFIAKHRPHLKRNALLHTESLDVSESDPVWLKAKGDEFHADGDYLSAVNAYSSAFEASGETMARALSNRSACYLRLAESDRCLADCRRALSVDDLSSEFPDERDAAAFRRRLHVRSASAHCGNGAFDAAHESLVSAAAVVVANDDDLFTAEIEAIDRLRKAAATRRKGDDALLAGDLEGATRAYDEVLGVEPTFVDALSNRATCRLALGEVTECLGDCDRCLELLSAEYEKKTTTTIATPIPPIGSERRRRLVVATLCRRGTARTRNGDVDGAIEDMETAYELEKDQLGESAKAIKNDLETLKQLRRNETDISKKGSCRRDNDGLKPGLTGLVTTK